MVYLVAIGAENFAFLSFTLYPIKWKPGSEHVCYVFLLVPFVVKLESPVVFKPTSVARKTFLPLYVLLPDCVGSFLSYPHLTLLTVSSKVSLTFYGTRGVVVFYGLL